MAQTKSISNWSEGTFFATRQEGSLLTLDRNYTATLLADRLKVNATLTESTYAVLLTLQRPAKIETVPAETYTIPEQVLVTEQIQVTYPDTPSLVIRKEGKIFGHKVFEVDFTIPGYTQKTVTETRVVVPFSPAQTVTTRPESSHYTDEGAVVISGTYVHDNPSEKVSIYLGDKLLASGYERIPFTYSGTAASCKTTVQEIKVLSLFAKTERGAVTASGFRKEVTRPGIGHWQSPVLQVGPFDIAKTFSARLQSEGTGTTHPSLVMRSRTKGGAWTEWSNEGLRETDTEFQFQVMLQDAFAVRSLTWSMEAEFMDTVDTFSGGLSEAEGFGLSYVPNLLVLIDGVDMTGYVSNVSDGKMSLVVPAGAYVPSNQGSKVTVYLDGELVDSGYTVGAMRPGSMSGTEVEVEYLRTGDLLGATMTNFMGGLGVEQTKTVVTGKTMSVIGSPSTNSTPTLPFNDEGGFILNVLGNSPGSAQLLMDTSKTFRSLDFWTAEKDEATGYGGLAFTEMSEWSQHYGSDSKVGLDIIEQVCAANMMSVFALEDGNLMASDLIPAKDFTLEQIVEGEMQGTERVSAAYLRFHEEGDKFVPDYRLYVPERRLSLSDMSPFVEVIGTSGPGQINKDVEPTPVYMMFQNGMSPTKEGKVEYSNWSPLNLSRAGGSNRFTLVDSQGNPIAIRPGTEKVKHVITSQRGNWDVKFNFHEGTLSYSDVDGDGNTVGDNDDVTGYTSISCNYKLTDLTTDSHVDITFMVTGEYLVNGEWETLELRGKPNRDFVPKWYPHLITEAGDIRRRFGFETREESNPYIVSLKNYPPAAPLEVQRQWESLPDMVATGLTLKEALKTRSTTLSYCGNAAWMPNQFVVIAKPPVEGIGATITSWEVYLTLAAGTFSCAVGGEVKTDVEAAYLGTVVRDGGSFKVASTDPISSDWYT